MLFLCDFISIFISLFFRKLFHILLRSHLPFTSSPLIPFLFFLFCLIEEWSQLVNNYLSSPLSSFFLHLNRYWYIFYFKNNMFISKSQQTCFEKQKMDNNDKKIYDGFYWRKSCKYSQYGWISFWSPIERDNNVSNIHLSLC